ncbi:MAG: carbon-nitrogen hydrolase family protein [Gammaproteobacteria bacterium]|nr:carbon-nitrogen hydrolase family protein [Gammaproteobacteria bacterium]MDH5274854.1 carbon-nitrogen hydrolase family protein [Gammaproteobacteria bacterium]
MKTLRISAIQMNSGDDVVTNLTRARRALRSAAADGARIAVLPENFALMGKKEADRLAIIEDDGAGPLQDFLAAEAARSDLWIVGGTIPLRSDDPKRPYAATLVYDGSGKRAGRYDKVHLFDARVPESEEAYRESRNTMPGSKPLLIDTPWGSLGVAVCYDLRFPEQFRRMSTEGLDVLAVPAAFTYRTGAAHWEPLLRARAIENLCYVAAAAQTGTHPGGRQTYGHSVLIDPWGAILADAGGRTRVITATIDTQRLKRLRQQFPVLDHRRFKAAG